MGLGEDRKLSASLEDYLEAIFNLADESGCARSKDIAEALGVARSSVTGALQLLREKGLAHHEPYGGVTLTRQGRAAAREVARKHEILKSFFMNVLGVEKEAAQRAACQAEHALESDIIGKLVSFTNDVTAWNAGGRDEVGESRRLGRKRSAKEKE
jgi:DtxR family Mn-dependent transcriptional regulator